MFSCFFQIKNNLLSKCPNSGQKIGHETNVKMATKNVFNIPCRIKIVDPCKRMYVVSIEMTWPDALDTNFSFGEMARVGHQKSVTTDVYMAYENYSQPDLTKICNLRPSSEQQPSLWRIQKYRFWLCSSCKHSKYIMCQGLRACGWARQARTAQTCLPLVVSKFYCLGILAFVVGVCPNKGLTYPRLISRMHLKFLCG